MFELVSTLMRSTLDGENVWWIQTQIRKTVFLLEEYQFCLFFSEIYSAHSGNTITMKDIEIMTHIIPRFGQNKRFGFDLLNQNTKDLDIQILLPKFLYPIWQVYQLLIRMIGGRNCYNGVALEFLNKIIADAKFGWKFENIDARRCINSTIVTICIVCLI